MVEIKLVSREQQEGGKEKLTFGAVNRGESLGECAFWGEGKYVHLAQVDEILKKDAYLLDGIIRAALNYALLNGYTTAVVNGLGDSELDTVLDKLGYYAHDMEIDIDGFFDQGCSGGGCDHDCANCNKQQG